MRVILLNEIRAVASGSFLMIYRLLAAFLALGCLGQAQTPKYHTGKLLQMESVQCVVFESQHGSDQAGIANCQEYVLEADSVLFHFRSRDPKRPALLPVGAMAQYRIEEGHFFLRVDGREREYAVVSMEPREFSAAPVKSAKVNHLQ